MKKFIFKTFIFILIIWLPWMLFINFGRFYYAPIDYLTWDYKHKLIKVPIDQFNPSQILLGDSLAVAAINPTLISKDFYNLSMSGMNPVDTWFYLDKYLKAKKTPKRVFLSFGITHWQGSDTFREQSIGFGMMTWNEIQELLKSSKNLSLFYSPEKNFIVFKDWFPFNLFWNYSITHFQKNIAMIEALLMRAGLTPLQLSHIKAVMGDMFQKKNIKMKNEIYNQMEITRGHHLFELNETTSFVNPLVQYSGWKIHPLNDLYLRKILDRLHKADIEVVIDFIPNNIHSWSKLKPEVFNEMESYFSGLQKIYHKLQVSKLESLPEKLFGDMDHVNLEGSRVYSRQFKEKYFSN